MKFTKYKYIKLDNNKDYNILKFTIYSFIRINKFVVCSLLILLMLVQCNKGNGTDYKENYNSRVLLLFLTRNTPNPQEKCIEASASAGKCLYVAKDKSPLATFATEEVYSANVLGLTINQFLSTYSDYCNKVIASSTYKNYSEEAKACNFSCQKEYWDKKSLEVCSATNTTDLFKGISSGTIDCIKNCLKVTNNRF